MADSPRLAELRRRLHADPRSLVFAALAEELRRAGALEDAIDTCVAGLVHHPGYTSARATLGRALLEAGQPDAAREELEAVVAQAPENLAAQRALVDAYRALDLPEQALDHCRFVSSLAPEDAELAALLAELDPASRVAGAEPAAFELVAVEADAAPAAPELERGEDAGIQDLEVVPDEPEADWPWLLGPPAEFGDAVAGPGTPSDAECAAGTGPAVEHDVDLVVAFDHALDLELGVPVTGAAGDAPQDQAQPQPPPSGPAEETSVAGAVPDGTADAEAEPSAGEGAATVETVETVENALERFLAAIRRERGGPPPVDLAS